MDIRIKYQPDDLNFDLGFLKNDLETDEGLESSVIVSLFTDARVTDDELPPGQIEKRGWWADAMDPTNTDLIGSKLWLLIRAKQTDDTLDLAKEYAEEALQWLLDDGVASSVTVTTSYPDDGRLLIQVVIERPGKNVVSYAYNVIWEGQANAI